MWNRGNDCFYYSIGSHMQHERKEEMKQHKKLTREQKIAVSAAGYLPDNWMLETEAEFYLHIIHKTTNTRRTVDRYAIPRKGGRK